jgi:HSP20 family protein
MAKQQKEMTTDPQMTKAPSFLGDDIDHMFDAFARGLASSPFYRRAVDREPFRHLAKATGTMTPDVDVTETDKEIRVTVELPGMEEKDIDVEMSGDRLTIRGEKKEEREKIEKDYHLSERRYGFFRRSMQLPDTVDSAKVDAQMKNGVLTLVLPKTGAAKSKARKVAIKKG